MVPNAGSSDDTQPVALRVTDLAASREFFQDLFGLLPAPDFPATHDSVLLTSPIPGHEHFSIRLTTAPVPVRLAGVHVELESVNELLDLYFLALLGGYCTSELRFRRSSLSTIITDPDGHTIEVEAHHGQASFVSAHGRRPLRAGGHVPGRDAGDFSRALENPLEPARSAAPAGAPRREPGRRPCAPQTRAR